MSDKPLITVTGATGQQGGAVVRALLDRGKFRVRAVTRSTESSAAKALASQGVELARADYDDRESLDKAFEGSHGVFLVTDYWKACGCNLEKELQQGKKLGDSAKQAGVNHVVWSTLEDTRPFIDPSVPELTREPGHYVGCFEIKADIQHYLDSIGLPATHLMTSGFFENLLSAQWQKAPDGGYVYATNHGHHKPVPYCALETIGKTAAVAFEMGNKTPGEVYTCLDEMLTAEELTDAISQATGKPVKYQELPSEVVAGFGFPGADEMANMYLYYQLNEKDARRVRPLDRRLVPVKKFVDWASEHKNELLDSLKKADAAQHQSG